LSTARGIGNYILERVTNHLPVYLALGCLIL